MKPIQRLSVFLSLSAVLLLFSLVGADAQCQRSAIKKLGVDNLKPYLFETVAFTEVHTDEVQPIEANFTVYKKERYRLVTMLNGFLDDVEVNLYDNKKNKLYTSKEGKEGVVGKFDFTADETGDYIIEFVFPPSKEDYVGVGCVAFLVGYQ